MATSTRDIKDMLIRRIEQLKTLSSEELEYSISDIVDSLLSSSVSVSQVVSPRSSPVPTYNPDRDGDYSAWLVSNNID